LSWSEKKTVKGELIFVSPEGLKEDLALQSLTYAISDMQFKNKSKKY
jgi:hypothetical protein